MDSPSSLRSLARSWYVVLAAVFAAVMASVVMTARATPLYRATATYVVSPDPSLTSPFDIVEALQALDRRSVVATYVEVLRSPNVLNQAARALLVPASDRDQYRVTAVVLPEANVVELNVDGPQPAMAVALNQAIGTQGAVTFTQLYNVYSVGLLDPPVLPTSPSSPRPIESAVLAGGLGFAIGAALALLWAGARERRLRRIRERIRSLNGLPPIPLPPVGPDYATELAARR